MMKIFLRSAAAVSVLLFGYHASSPASAQSNANLIDPAIKQAVAGQRGWGYVKQASADLDGDGVQERVFLIANAENRRGKPVWDDAQIWQVYIEEPDGKRTYVFSRWVQLGRVEAIMTDAERNERPSVVLVERTPHTFTVYEVRYRRPSDVEVVELVKRPTNARAGFTGSLEQ